MKELDGSRVKKKGNNILTGTLDLRERKGNEMRRGEGGREERWWEGAGERNTKGRDKDKREDKEGGVGKGRDED